MPSNISMIHLDSRPISLELKGRTLTATLTEDIFAKRTVLECYLKNVIFQLKNIQLIK